MNLKTISYTLLIILLCAISIFILHHGNIISRLKKKDSMDSFVLNPSYTQYNDAGEIKTKAIAKKFMHFSPSGTSHFTKPFIITYTDDRTPWHIRADHGIANKTGDKIILSGHVFIRQLPTKTQAECKIISTELTIFPNKYIMTTDKAVTLSHPGVIIHGTGFHADLKTGKYQLLSQTKAVYQPVQ